MLRTVTTRYGKVKGLPAANPLITVFRGIPFAAPPVGELRWRAPQPPRQYSGVLEAYEFPPISMQAVPGQDPDDLYTREWHVDPDLPMSEDCLYLNIWTPAKSGREHLPVMVWFFGGGLNGGYPGEMEFDGERLARRGTVIVTINYRTNVFGFLAHPDLTAAGTDRCVTNFGLYDQRQALIWVRENIEAFGGDPTRITIAGQSGGGRSVLFQALSPLNDLSLFRRGISMSGSGITFGFIRYQTLREAEHSGEEFFRILGVRTVEEARKIPADELEKASLAQRSVRWGAVVDGIFLPDQPSGLLFRNQRLPIPLMLGCTADEMWDFFHQADTPEKFSALVSETLGNSANGFLSLCGWPDSPLEELRSRAAVNHQRLCVELLALRSAQAGWPVWFYEFGPDIPGWDHPGAFHSSDLWFAFESLGKCWRPFQGRHYDLARMMCNYFANFIRSGDPNGPDADGSPMPEWIPYTERTPWSMDFRSRPVMDHTGPSPAVDYLLHHIVI